MRTSIAIVALAMAATARADQTVAPGERAAIGGGYRLEYDAGGLRLRHGHRTAPLTIAGDRPTYQAVTIVRRGADVTLGFMPTCWDVDQTFSRDQLAARLEHAAGRAARRRDLDAALAHLTRAHTLDPGFAPAAHDLAVALAAAGRLDEAAAALPIADPIARYVAVALDDELAALREHPTVIAARAPAPGTGALGPLGLGVTPDGAVVGRESRGNHGACSTDDDLVILDGATLRERARIPQVRMADYRGDGCDQPTFGRAGRRRIAAREARARQVLIDLGVTPLAGELATVSSDWTRHVQKLRFAAAGLGLVIGADGAARWFRDGALVAEHGPGTAHQPGGLLLAEPIAVLVPDQRRVIAQIDHAGCEWNEEVSWYAIPMP